MDYPNCDLMSGNYLKRIYDMVTITDNFISYRVLLTWFIGRFFHKNTLNLELLTFERGLKSERESLSDWDCPIKVK